MLSTHRIKGGWGWRLSLGLGGVPALLLTLGAFLVVDTPNSLIERGHLEQGKAVLRKIRGIENIEPEFLELVEASRVAKEVKHPFKNILKRSNRPQLVISIALQVSSVVFSNIFLSVKYTISSSVNLNWFGPQKFILCTYNLVFKSINFIHFFFGYLTFGVELSLDSNYKTILNSMLVVIVVGPITIGPLIDI